MKKTFLSIGAIVLVAIAGFGVSKSMSNNEPKLSMQVMANVEALTGGEITVEDICVGPTDKICIIDGMKFNATKYPSSK